MTESSEPLREQRSSPIRLGPFRNFVATVGAGIIYALIWLFGRKVKEEDVPWLVGPLGGRYIGDEPYAACAEREGLSLERDASKGGLISSMDLLNGGTFDASGLHPDVRSFYERTAEYRMDVWAEARFPANIALWLLVTTISRKVNQLNFPLNVLDTAKGMMSEIILLRRPSGEVKYTGWYRRLAESGHVVYTGFYMPQHIPVPDRPAVKVVFPMPSGSATVILTPSVEAGGALKLVSSGSAFGDAGFYRIQRAGEGCLRVWRIRSLKETIDVYVDEDETLRTDHSIAFLGLPVLKLHYRIEPKH